MSEFRLRPWTPEDRDTLVALVSKIDRTYLSSRLPDPFTAAEAESLLARECSREGVRGVYRAILLNGEVVGNVHADMQDFPEGCRDATLSCWLAPEACGRGLGGRAIRAITALAFDTLPVVRLSAWICAPNLPSRRCVEQAGFTREALLRQAVSHGEEDWDLCIYGKLREEQ